MRNIITLFALLFAGFSFAQTAQNETAMKYAETITIGDMKEDLTILASNALEGRETGKRGQKMAAAYIKAHFEELGLIGPVKNGPNPYYQNVVLKSSRPSDIYIKVGDTKLKNIDDFFYTGSVYNTDEISTEIVFAGGGTDKEFEGLDLKGKSIFIQTTDRRIRQEALNKVKENGGKMLFVVYAEDQELRSVV